MIEVSVEGTRPFFSPPEEKISDVVCKVALGVICKYLSYGFFAIGAIAFVFQAAYCSLALLVSGVALKLIEYYYSYTKNEIKTLAQNCINYNDKQSVRLLLNTDPVIRQMLSELTVKCLKEKNEKKAIHLIKMGANVNQIVLDGKWKTTVLHKAVWSNCLDVMAYLLDTGYSIDRFPAQCVWRTETLEFLMKNNANLQKANFLQHCFQDIVDGQEPVWSAQTIVSLIKDRSITDIASTFCNMTKLRPFLAENDHAIKQKLSSLKKNKLITKDEHKILLRFLNNPGMITRKSPSGF